MLPRIIKFQYDRTIDYTRMVDEPCPRCGGSVYRILENNDEVFCTRPFCRFHDFINHHLYNTIIEKLTFDIIHHSHQGSFVKITNDKELHKFITFDRNRRYSNCHLPVMFVDDFEKGEYIIRDLKLNEEYWNSIDDTIKQYCGLTRNTFYDMRSPIIARYYNLQHLVESGWTPNHDIQL